MGGEGLQRRLLVGSRVPGSDLQQDDAVGVQTRTAMPTEPCPNGLPSAEGEDRLERLDSGRGLREVDGEHELEWDDVGAPGEAVQPAAQRLDLGPGADPLRHWRLRRLPRRCLLVLVLPLSQPGPETDNSWP